MKSIIGFFVVSAGVALGVSCIPVGTDGPVTDPLGVVVVPNGAPIHIGGYWTLSGPDIDLGLDQKRGAEIAMDDHGNIDLPPLGGPAGTLVHGVFPGQAG